MTSHPQQSVPFAAQAIPFDEYLASGKIPEGLLTSEYVEQQFVERLVHYVLSVPAGSYTMAQLSRLLEQLDPRAQVFSAVFVAARLVSGVSARLTLQRLPRAID